RPCRRDRRVPRIIDDRRALADDAPWLARLDDERRRFVDADREERWMFEHDADQSIVTFTAKEVLVDDGAVEQAKAVGDDDVFPSHRDEALRRVAPRATGSTLVAGEHGCRHHRRPR